MSTRLKDALVYWLTLIVFSGCVFGVLFGIDRLFNEEPDTADVPMNVPLFTPCEHEDSLNCIWLASEQGNGLGTSFISGPIEQPVFPISDDAARYLLSLTD